MSCNSYSSALDGNIMVLGKTGSGKTSLVQRWGLNGFFKIKKVYWISSLELDENRKTDIDSSFSQEVVFTVTPNVQVLERVIHELKIIAEQKQQESESNTSDERDVIGERTKYDSLVVFDDMSTIADKSRGFAHFLTVSRKFNYICVYIFHIMDSKDSYLWSTIVSQTHIYCFLNLGSLPPKIKSLISDNCTRSEYDRNNYLSRNNMWLTKLITSLFNNHSKEHVLIDNRESCGNMCKIRSRSDELETQICYYPIENDNRYFNKYTSVRNKYKEDCFELSHLVGNTIGGENIHFKLREGLLKADNHFDSINHLEDYITNEKVQDISLEATENESEPFAICTTNPSSTPTTTSTTTSAANPTPDTSPRADARDTSRSSTTRTYPKYSNKYRSTKRRKRRITTFNDIYQKRR